ncbi:putative membrane protein [Campylobacter blaseri]|uniref:Yip1 domain-containing protein n=1 Tax=Campylobacter blaseri TaxID=2042961 RepID=A0A2P8QYB0_9BACT|nr:hypothetical protein [Campylobacter blaseri]PSM51238.1 hypothetical protein CQ405_08965 [Campylobacter blaseri]PSM52382.1 hypothetical protein CRN67_08970 [Campylobacter blaseri]QKF86606.1 putative membrane protein [Campylobacter blaseri]
MEIDNSKSIKESKKQDFKIKKETFREIIDLFMSNKWISTVIFFGLGLLIYSIYFYINYKYIPSLTWGESLGVVIYTSSIFLLLPTLILILVFVFWFFYHIEKDLNTFSDDNYYLIYYKSSFIWIISFIISLFIFLAMVVSDLTKSLCSFFLIFVLSLIFLSFNTLKVF